MLDFIQYMTDHRHEQFFTCTDAESGLKALIALHNTTRGPGLGGCRLWQYDTHASAVLDVLRLSEAMTYKAAVAGLPLGGGKAVILADGNEDDPDVRAARFEAFARFIDGLGGQYITAEDIGTAPEDMVRMQRITPHVAGIPVELGGSGDPSPMTAFGVLEGIRALAARVLGKNSLQGVRVAIQGLGKVGHALAHHLVEEGAHVTGSDVYPERASAVQDRLGIDIVPPDRIYDVPCDVFAPCAVGAVINDHTIPRLTCRVIAGAANNQLEDLRHGEILHLRGIVYAVDYVINAGGLINVAHELDGYDETRARAKTADIYHTIERLLEISREEDISTQQAAQQLARLALQPEADREVSALG